METMPKQKVTVTIEKKLLDWTDRQIESFRFRNRSHAFEYALARLMETEKKTAERHDQLL
jgi:Arc/MetJ-type ribon-helix-helix transcriptional regulator